MKGDMHGGLPRVGELHEGEVRRPCRTLDVNGENLAELSKPVRSIKISDTAMHDKSSSTRLYLVEKIIEISLADAFGQVACRNICRNQPARWLWAGQINAAPYPQTRPCRCSLALYTRSMSPQTQRSPQTQTSWRWRGAPYSTLRSIPYRKSLKIWLA